MNHTNHEHTEAPKERATFREMALPLDNPKRLQQQGVTLFLPAVAGLASFRGEYQTGHTAVDELEDFVSVIGTAFFYAYPQRGTDGTDSTQMGGWLVTAKHVTQSAFYDSQKVIALRVNTEDGSGVGILPPSTDVIWHHHETLDVSVSFVNTMDLIDKKYHLKHMSAALHAFNRTGAIRFGLAEGDAVFMIGFPLGWQEGIQDYPVVRQGIIAEIRGWLNGDHDTFLVDGSGFPGMSGGPVLSRTMEYTPDGRTGEKLRLIGLVSQIALSELEESFSEVRSAAKESADLITVIPTDAIHETIEAAMEARAASSD